MLIRRNVQCWVIVIALTSALVPVYGFAQAAGGGASTGGSTSASGAGINSSSTGAVSGTARAAGVGTGINTSVTGSVGNSNAASGVSSTFTSTGATTGTTGSTTLGNTSSGTTTIQTDTLSTTRIDPNTGLRVYDSTVTPNSDLRNDVDTNVRNSGTAADRLAREDRTRDAAGRSATVRTPDSSGTVRDVNGRVTTH